MSFYFNGTQANVTISGGITQTFPTPGTTQTLYCTDRIQGTGALQTLFTTTAGKTAYVTSIIAFASASTSANIYKNDGTTVLCQMGIDAANGSCVWSGGGSPLFSVAASQALKANHGNNVWVTVTYFEV